jgi:hypothetical protein
MEGIENQSEKRNIESENLEIFGDMRKLTRSYFSELEAFYLEEEKIAELEKTGTETHEEIEKRRNENKKKGEWAKRMETKINIFSGFLITKGIDPLDYRLYYILIGEGDPGKEREGKKYKFDTTSETVDPFGPGLIQLFIESNFKK